MAEGQAVSRRMPTSRIVLFLAGAIGLHLCLGGDPGVRAQSPPGPSRDQDLGGSGKPEVTTPQDPPVDDLSVQRFLRAKFAEARALFKQGQYHAAFRTADSILTLYPDLPFREEVLTLRRRAQARHLGQSVLTVRFELESEPAFPARTIRGRLVLENVSAQNLVIGEPGTKGIFGQAIFVVTDVFPDGSELSNRGSRVVRGRGFELEAGALHRMPLELELPGTPGFPVMQIIELDGGVRPSVLRTDGRDIPRTIPWHRTRDVVVPKELLDVSQDPYRELQLALIAGDIPRVVVASRLWRARLDEDGDLAVAARERTVDLFLSTLDEEIEILRHIAVQELIALTGYDRIITAEDWQRWGGDRARRRAKTASSSP